MEYVNFGRAGVKVSRLALGLGFRALGTRDEATRVIEHAIDSGINLIDCSNFYGLAGGEMLSEEILAGVLKRHRDNLVITSKVFMQIGPGPNDRGSSRYHVMREVERSLNAWTPTISTSTCSTGTTRRRRSTRRCGRWTT